MHRHTNTALDRESNTFECRATIYINRFLFNYGTLYHIPVALIFTFMHNTQYYNIKNSIIRHLCNAISLRSKYTKFVYPATLTWV